MNDLSDEDFRLVVREWVAANYPPEIRNPLKRLHWNECKSWYFKLAEKGWLCPGWPVEHGGMGLSPGKQLIMLDEFERHGCARTIDQGVLMVGPLLIAHGTEEQRAFFLPKVLTGEHVWCQGCQLDLRARTYRQKGEKAGGDWVFSRSYEHPRYYRPAADDARFE